MRPTGSKHLFLFVTSFVEYRLKNFVEFIMRTTFAFYVKSYSFEPGIESVVPSSERT